MILKNGKYEYHNIPKILPCGTEVNRTWRPGLPVECCRTVCTDKTDGQIEFCHREQKRLNRRAEFEPPKEDGYGKS